MNEPEDAAPPIFVVGHSRSGTTLLAATLNAHPRLACGPETAFFDSLGRGRWRHVVSDPAWPGEALEFLTSMTRGEGGSVVEAYGAHVDDLRLELASRQPSVRSLLEAITAPYARRQGKSRWVEKTPRHLLRAGEIRRLWPEAMIVRIVRDPRAVAVSFEGVPFGPSSAVGTGYLWRGMDDATWRFFERDPLSVTVRYEDLVRQPERELRRLCDALGESFDPRMLQPADFGSEALAAADEPWKMRVMSAIDGTRVEAWRQELPPADQRRVALVCGEGMRRYGYEGSLEPRAEAWAKPLDLAFLDDAASLLSEAADAGLVFRASATRWPAERGRLLLWGADGQLRWAAGGRGASARALIRWTGELARARLGGRPALWVRRETARQRSRSWAERAGDALARRFAQEVRPGEVLPLVPGPPR